MQGLLDLPHRLHRGHHSCRAVIETPAGKRSKFTYDPHSGLFELTGLLPEGMHFPLDFGFVPSTLGEDGDPLDILVLADEATFTGCLMTVRLIGVMDARQTEEGVTQRNDRLLAVSGESLLHTRVRRHGDLPAHTLEQLTRFFVNYNELKGKRFEVDRIGGPELAMQRIEEGAAAWQARSASPR